MRPCTGVEGVCPPLCKWHELHDGTYTLADVERFNITIAELVQIKAQQVASKDG